MFAPDDPLAPPRNVFDEPWQAQALALADTLVQAGHISAGQWARALGAALARAEAEGAPDTLATYYECVIAALEDLGEHRLGISPEARLRRRTDWEEAYHRTPHGKPVEL